MTTLTSEQTDRGGLVLPLLFTATVFASALLLFFVQPLFTRMILPLIGGAPAVWTTAMLFFQTVLIGGYLYAHLLTRYLAPRVQVAVHLGLILAAAFALPLAVPPGWSPDPDQPVVLQTLWLYALGVGLPFAALSANAPLLQAWYRLSGARGASDPYFLYAASNLGSLVALLAFPLVAEPLFGMTALSSGWSIGFLALGAALLASGLAIGRPARAVVPDASARAAGPGPSASRIAYWAALAFLPSSLMLCVTTRISTDLGALPLVWVVPLALYLLTFVLVFSDRSPLTAARLRLVLPIAVAYLVFSILVTSTAPLHFVLQIVAFFIVALVAHRQLFDARPEAAHLTVYYLVMSIGGALGGLFNSIVAPLAFDRLTEVPVTIACIALLLVGARAGQSLAREMALGLVAAVAILAVFLVPQSALEPMVRLTVLARALVASVLLLGLFYLWRQRGVAAATTLVAITGLWTALAHAPALVRDRSFFGLHIVHDLDGRRIYTNGNTSHGAQRLSELGRIPTPLYYYHPNGPLAEIVTLDRGKPLKSVGIVGLGVGAMSCYAKPGEDWHFYEIDQKVVDIARDSRLFDYMSRCGAEAAVHVGDARIVLHDQTEARFDILVIDAYSSNVVPVHLTTLEAVALYRDRLADGGIVAFHISNRYYDLAEPLAAIAKALGLVGRVKIRAGDEVDAADGDFASNVLILAETEAALGPLATDPTWKPLPETDRTPWTDDHSDVLSALR